MGHLAERHRLAVEGERRQGGSPGGFALLHPSTVQLLLQFTLYPLHLVMVVVMMMMKMMMMMMVMMMMMMMVMMMMVVMMMMMMMMMMMVVMMMMMKNMN